MRAYSSNSAQAAARVVALAMLADGRLCKAEMDTLERLGVAAQLGLTPAQMHTVVHGLCEDLLGAGERAATDTCPVAPATLAALLAEVSDPALRAKVLNLSVALVEADAHVAAGEALVLVSAIEQWGLQQQMLNGRRRLAPMHAA